MQIISSGTYGYYVLMQLTFGICFVYQVITNIHDNHLPNKKLVKNGSSLTVCLIQYNKKKFKYALRVCRVFDISLSNIHNIKQNCDKILVFYELTFY